MPFGYPSNNKEIDVDLSNYIPVSTMVTFDKSGNMRIDYIRIINADKTEDTCKILGVKDHKEINGGIMYCCYINYYNKRLQINLFFYVLKHTWYMQKM